MGSSDTVPRTVLDLLKAARKRQSRLDAAARSNRALVRRLGAALAERDAQKQARQFDEIMRVLAEIQTTMKLSTEMIATLSKHRSEMGAMVARNHR
ncbi:hypothetical protein LNKW23_36450 [Paralimibaculum aggregatum]|uniref:Uncharacterized protein n=1 Tax=Paralimibaculum aggregatum TaxID=3036245 RepID=A0ABQ6LPM5_9RHOB|nr:hypothetical protein [Limibaculum sp. NKW23]GMG84429.1 hypothetical protein LNKW23_36450 [Limibaculum sp. NKW23]